MSQIIKPLLLNTIYSGCIGLLVGIIAILPLQIDENPTKVLLISAFIGIMIGTASKLSVILLYRYTKGTLWMSCCMVLVVAGLITLAVAYPFDLINKVILLAIVEPSALVGMFINIVYSRSLNERLKCKQAALQHHISSKNQ